MSVLRSAQLQKTTEEIDHHLLYQIANMRCGLSKVCW